ncbi:uncharacterized protein LOC106164212 [Lingula anatina]|uniref:Uncharacterized protein LOC106164212 n=1 Tax=Lingula anatina TaxID=7574 RepID=A0A1S3IGV5_LINAN|nr:uncharacterized protein LOC106164212 [Lingula anatina]|eukprot:XP_013397495.1 uncharacterized protein LOC106164212 [Lingula anatina]
MPDIVEIGFRERLLINIWRLSKKYKVSLVTSFLGLLVFIIGFSTPHWAVLDGKQKTVSVGLWEICFDGYCDYLGIVGGWLAVTRTLECIGFIFILKALIVSLVYVCVPRFDTPGILYTQAGLHFVAALLVLVGDIIFGVYKAQDGYVISWSLVLTILMIILEITSGILVVLHSR